LISWSVKKGKGRGKEKGKKEREYEGEVNRGQQNSSHNIPSLSISFFSHRVGGGEEGGKWGGGEKKRKGGGQRGRQPAAGKWSPTLYPLLPEKKERRGGGGKVRKEVERAR